jgi:hypothetical protein
VQALLILFSTIFLPAFPLTTYSLFEMLEQIFDQLGFVFTLLFVMGCFISFVFWMAGIAGLLEQCKGKPVKEKIIYALCILVPPYPVIWLLYDVARQSSKIKMRKRSDIKVS